MERFFFFFFFEDKRTHSQPSAYGKQRPRARKAISGPPTPRVAIRYQPHRTNVAFVALVKKKKANLLAHLYAVHNTRLFGFNRDCHLLVE